MSILLQLFCWKCQVYLTPIVLWEMPCLSFSNCSVGNARSILLQLFCGKCQVYLTPIVQWEIPGLSFSNCSVGNARSILLHYSVGSARSILILTPLLFYEKCNVYLTPIVLWEVSCLSYFNCSVGNALSVLCHYFACGKCQVYHKKINK